MLKLRNAPITGIEHSAQALLIRKLVGIVNTPDNTKKPTSSDKGRVSGETRAEHRRLYRSLLKFGEQGAMMRRCLSVHDPLRCVSYGKQLESLHEAFNAAAAHSRQIFIIFHPFQFLHLTLKRHFYKWNIRFLRLSLRIWNLLSDMLVCILFIMLGVLLWAILRLCSVILIQTPT